MEEFLAPVAVVLVWLGLVVFFRAYRIWLPYYVVGAVGLATGIIFFGSNVFPIETWFKLGTGLSVHFAGEFIGVPTKLFENVPGSLLVLVIDQNVGWTVVHIDIECSGFLESAAFMGLFAFYPGFSRRKRLGLILIGLTATYVANMVRLLTIIAFLHWGGKDTLFMSHTIVGRAVFFAIIIYAYWLILTKPTINAIRLNMKGDARE